MSTIKYRKIIYSDLKEMLHSVAIINFFIFVYFIFIFVAMLVRKIKGPNCNQMDDPLQDYTQNIKKQETKTVVQNVHYMSNQSGDKQNQQQANFDSNPDANNQDINIQIDQDNNNPRNVDEPVQQQKIHQVQNQPQEQLSAGVRFFLGCERFVVEMMPWILIVLINIGTNGCYIMNVFFFFVWLIMIVVFNYLQVLKSKGAQVQAMSEYAHQLVIFILFMASFGNDQTKL